MKKQTIAGWGNYPISHSYLSRPEKISTIPYSDGRAIPRGLGRSYGDAALNEDSNVILMERLNRFLDFDEEKGLLRAEGGVTLEDILNVFVPRGWFAPVTPGTKFVTLGGCIAADVHGKNHHVDGTFGDFVQEFSLLIADGSIKHCSPTENTELYWATIGGMGLTGIITEATIQLLPIETAYVTVENHKAKDLETVFSMLDDRSNDDKYSVAWIDCLSTGKDLGRSVLMHGHHSKKNEVVKSKKNPLVLKPKRKLSIPFNFPSWALNSWSMKIFNNFYYRIQGGKVGPFLQDYDSFFYPLDSILNWKKIYGKRGFIQYQFVIPSEYAHQALKEVLEKLTDSQRASFLAVLKRFGKEGKGLLSFPKEGYTLALDIPISDTALFPFLDLLDEIIMKYNGREYLAKDARMKPNLFRMMYPRFSQWLRIKNSIDPNNFFSSDLSRRLHMEELP